MTKTKVEQRAKEELAAAKAVAKDLREDMDEERRARIAGYLQQASDNSLSFLVKLETPLPPSRPPSYDGGVGAPHQCPLGGR